MYIEIDTMLHLEPNQAECDGCAGGGKLASDRCPLDAIKRCACNLQSGLHNLSHIKSDFPHFSCIPPVQRLH